MSLRVFAPAEASPTAGDAVTLDREESRYLRRVRRARDGDPVELFDGRGGLWSATVRGGDRAVTLAIGEAIAPAAPRRRLTLLLGLPDTSATLQAITQASELGVATIALVRCARSQGRAPTDDRVDRVLRAAQRQCGRPTPPAVLGPFDLARALEIDADAPGFFAAMVLRGAVDPAPRPGPSARLLVGPEGGLVDDEHAALRAAGWAPLGLGAFTLRTETAALVGLSRLLFAEDP
ncbi:MAG: RsmE family RNA methyltransferase [Nannocystaceae bacterium]